MAPMKENRGPELLAVNVFFSVSAVLAVALRCYVRGFLVKAFGRDDWLMALALVFFIAYSASSITGVHFGTGQHHADLTQENIESAMECWWYCYLFYALSMITSKMSIAYFLLRIATQKMHIWIIHGAMLFTVVSGVVFFFVTMLQCQPVSYFWYRRQDGQCIDVNVVIGLAYLYSVFSVISDMTFAILPGFLVWGLQLTTRAKLSLIPLLVMGCVASSAVVVRFAFLMRLKDPDFLWATLDTAIWSSVEQGLAITAGSLATIRPLLKIIGYKLGLTSNPSRMRVTDDVSRRPSAFMNSNPLHSSHMNGGQKSPGVSKTTGGGGGSHAAQEDPEDEYGLSVIPCKCCGKFKCAKRQSDAASSKRRSSLGIRSMIGKDDARALSKIKSVSESEEELRQHEDSQHGSESVVPKSFLSGQGRSK